MKRKYLATLALAGILVFCGAPIVVSASSPNAGGMIVNGDQGNVGDTLDIGGGEVPLEAGEDDVQQDIGEGEVPLNAGEGGASQEDIGEGNVPLAVMSNEAVSGGTNWVPYAVVGGLAIAVVGTGVWAAARAGAVKDGARGYAVDQDQKDQGRNDDDR